MECTPCVAGIPCIISIRGGQLQGKHQQCEQTGLDVKLKKKKTAQAGEFPISFRYEAIFDKVA